MTVLGVDLSNWQPGISLQGVKDEGLEFVICKVTEGAAYRSPEWPMQRDAAKAAGLTLAGYHYITEDDPAQQAANCRAYIGDLDIPIALDFERRSGTDFSRFAAMLDACRAAGLRVALSYIPRWYWTQVGEPDLSQAPPLWASRYVSSAVKPAQDLVAGLLPDSFAGYGGNVVKLVQFSASALVQGRALDANVWPGTRQELIDFLYPSSQGPPVPSPGWVLSDAEVDRIADAVWAGFVARLRRKG